MLQIVRRIASPRFVPAAGPAHRSLCQTPSPASGSTHAWQGVGLPLVQRGSSRRRFGSSGQRAGSNEGTSWSQAECLTVAGLACAIVAGSTVTYKGFSKLLAKSIVEMVETYDRSFIGVDIDIGTLYIYPLSGKAQILDLTIMNPPDFETPFMMKTGKITLDLDLWSILNPYSKKIIVQKATFKHCILNVEYHHLWEGKSNLDEIIDRAHKPAQEPDPKWKAKKEAAKKANAGAKEWWIQELKLVDIEVHYNRGAFKKEIMLPDIVYDHFSEEVGSNLLDDVVIILLQFIAKNVIAHITSPAIASMLMSKDDDK